MTYVSASRTARIQHAQTGEIFEIDADELDFDAVGSDERNMGPEIHHQAVLEHPSLGTLSWDLWEYPVGAENMTETDAGEHTVLENIEFGLEHEPDDDEPPEDEELPQEPLPVLLARLPAQLAALDQALSMMAELQPRLGHNQPPEEFRFGVTELDLVQVRESVVDVRQEVERPNPVVDADHAKLQLAQSRLSGLASKLSGWGKTVGGGLLVGIATGVGKGIGDQIWQEVPALRALVHVIQETLSVWVDALMAIL